VPDCLDSSPDHDDSSRELLAARARDRPQRAGFRARRPPGHFAVHRPSHPRRRVTAVRCLEDLCRNDCWIFQVVLAAWLGKTSSATTEGHKGLIHTMHASFENTAVRLDLAERDLGPGGVHVWRLFAYPRADRTQCFGKPRQLRGRGGISASHPRCHCGKVVEPLRHIDVTLRCRADRLIHVHDMDEYAIQRHGIRPGVFSEFFVQDVTQSQLGEFKFGTRQTCL